MKLKLKQLGQGMTEYIYGLFGDTLRGQMGVMTEELAGQTGAANVADPETTEATAARGLEDFSEGTQ
jgi:hypothetical protein